MQMQACKTIIKEETLSAAVDLLKLEVPLARVIKNLNLTGASRPVVKRQIDLYAVIKSYEGKGREGVFDFATKYLLKGINWQVLAEADLNCCVSDFVAEHIDQMPVLVAYSIPKIRAIQSAAKLIKKSATVRDLVGTAMFPPHAYYKPDQSLVQLDGPKFDGLYPVGTWRTPHA